MTDLLYRSFTPDLEVRSGGDGRTVHGIAVPWGVEQRIDVDLVETFARGAFNHQLRAANRVRFAREHVDLGGTLIGATRLMRDDASGLYVELRASKTPEGDATLELIRDGALPHLSIGFRERRNRRLRSGAIERVQAHLFEIAATMEGAYGDTAPITGVRTAGGGHGHDDTAVEYCPECAHCTVPAGVDEVRRILADLPALAS
ncbi:HK97 family phage prohead protease [Micromonospora aurantiaca]|uniref:HK97 family phage prohead protease n=1 Tax=Micromonospora aurantiaca (nom. illeg.) TaxID=47850 RepID=UPI0034286394